MLFLNIRQWGGYVLALALLVFPVLSLGQSFNLDVGGSFFGQAPDATYAGAGVEGYWNLITDNAEQSSITFALYGLDGQATTVTATTLDRPRDLVGDSNTAISGRTDSEIRLVRDYLVFLKELRFSGLMPGDYLVTAYAAGTGGEAYPGIIEVVGEDTMGIALAGRYGASLVEGSSHGNAIVTVGSDQQLSIFPDSASDRFLNGVQIQLVPEPGAAFILTLCGLAAVRRR